MKKNIQFRQAFAEMLRYYRTLAGLTQSELAKRIDGSEIGVRTWERAASCPSLETFLLLADAIEVEAEEFLGEILNRTALIQNLDNT